MLESNTTRIKRYCLSFILLFPLMINTSICHGYIMPAEQLVGFLTNNFTKIETVDAIMSVSLKDREKDFAEIVFPQRMKIKRPDLFHFINLDHYEFIKTIPDTIHLQLLVSNAKERIELLLSWMGIDLNSTSFTRIDGIISYRIGAAHPDRPKILIEKERFVPLLLVYKAPYYLPEDTISVRFKDYRKIEQGWFPHEITCSIGERIIYRYHIQIIMVNKEIDDDLLRPSSVDLSHEKELKELRNSIIEQERIRRINKNNEYYQ